MVSDNGRPPPRARGFAAMTEEQRRAIAKKGGQSGPKRKRSFSFNPHLAAKAGRKGGQNVASEQRSFSRDPILATEAGRKGGTTTQSQKLKRIKRDKPE